VPDTHLELTITNDLASLAEVRDAVSRAVREGGFPQQYVNRLQIAVDEAVTNIIEHGYADQQRGRGSIWITIDVSKDRFRIEVADNGTTFDPNTLTDMDIAKHVAAGSSGGLGVFLMRKIMDVVDYRFEAGVKNRLVLVKNR
jgi:anti-sigma regulatory factor (Ser/Thr protein kinase)